MKKLRRFFYPHLLLVLLLSACASRPPSPVVEMERPVSPGPEVIITMPSPIEQMIQRIRQNGPDIEKYFILDEDRRIIVKANVQGDVLGIGDFEVIYDLDGAEVRTSALGDFTFVVRFSARNKESGAIIEDSLIWRPVATNAGLLLSFDDVYVETWERYFDLFDRYGARVTFFLQGEYNPFAAKALNRGHDIGYHSLNHLDLRKLSRVEFYRETLGPVESFKQAGVPLSAFAYPYGFSEPWMHEILLQYFGVLRGYGVTFRLYNEDRIRSAFISSRAIDNTVIREEEDFDRLIISMLRTVKFLEGGHILPLTTHDISYAAWAISSRRLEFLLKTASELGLKFYRFSDFAQVYR